MRCKTVILGMLATFVVAGSVVAIERSTNTPTDTSVTVTQAEPDTSKPQMDIPGRPGPFGERGGFGPGPEKFERLRMRKLIELLGLEGEQKDAFVTIAENHRVRRMEQMRIHMATVDSLAVGIRSGSLDEKGIEGFVMRLEVMEARQMKMRKAFRDEVRPLLNTRQYGKLVVFDYRFEAKIFDRLNEFRKRRGGPAPDMPPPPDDMDSFLDDDSF